MKKEEGFPAIESAADFACRVARHFENALVRQNDFRKVNAPGLAALIESRDAAIRAQALEFAVKVVEHELDPQSDRCERIVARIRSLIAATDEGE